MSIHRRTTTGTVLMMVLSLLLPGTGCDRADEPTLRVLAAASLKPVVDADLIGSGTDVSLGASSMLSTQLIAGAPADVVVLVDSTWMDALEARGVVVPGTRIAIASNRLVVVVPVGDGTTNGEGLPGGRFAIAETRNVPLGRYTLQALESLGWWDVVEGRSVVASDARAVLGLVESGEVDVGIVYASDASVSSRVRIVRSIDPMRHRVIRCEAALIRDTPEARACLERLRGPIGRTRLLESGFRPPVESTGDGRP